MRAGGDRRWSGCLAATSLIFLGMSSASATHPIELWRRNTEFLRSDREHIRSCVDAADTGEKMTACVHVIREACQVAPSEEAPTPPSALRACAWRGIAAWEDEMAVTIDELNAKLDDSGRVRLAISQRDWKISMLADVALRGGVDSGGSLEGLIAAETREDETAMRDIFLVEFARLQG